jgi:hydroxyacylglutathione hydrolase
MAIEVTALPVTPLDTNCFVAVDSAGRKAMIVDPGGDAEQITALVDRLGAKPAAIALTHGHADHFGALAEIAAAYPEAERICSRETQEFLRDWRKHLGPFIGMNVDAVEMTRIVAAGDEVKVGESAFKVSAAPGHTPGDIILYHRPARGKPMAFVGDVIFAGGIGRTDFPGGDIEALEKSIRTVVYRLPDDCILYTGHGPATTVGGEKSGNPFVHE